jgi:hypothetical protein
MVKAADPHRQAGGTAAPGCGARPPGTRPTVSGAPAPSQTPQIDLSARHQRRCRPTGAARISAAICALASTRCQLPNVIQFLGPTSRGSSNTCSWLSGCRIRRWSADQFGVRPAAATMPPALTPAGCEYQPSAAVHRPGDRDTGHHAVPTSARRPGGLLRGGPWPPLPTDLSLPALAGYQFWRTSRARGPRKEMLGWKVSCCPSASRSRGKRRARCSTASRVSSLPRLAPRQ